MRGAKSIQRWSSVGLIALVLLLGISHYLYNCRYGIDDSFITYRYAYNFAEGDGLVFNLGERHYGSTAAGFAIMLGAIAEAADRLSRPLGFDGDLRELIPAISRVFSLVAWLVSAGLLVAISRRAAGNLVGSVLGAAIILALFLSPLSSIAYGHETYVFLSLWLLSSYLACFERRHYWPAVILAVATTIRPDTVLFAGAQFLVLGLVYVRASGFRHALDALARPAAIYLVLILSWLASLWVYYGQPLPETRVAKHAQVLLGQWPLFTPRHLVTDLSPAIPLWFIAIMLAGAVAIAFNLLSRRMRGRGRANQSPNIPTVPAIVSFSLIWGLSCLGIVAAYTLLDVTYWRWYGIPVWFAMACLLPGFTYAIMPDLRAASLARKLIALTVFVGVAFIYVKADTPVLRYYLKLMADGKHISEHIGSYDGAIAMLRESEPNGTSVATAEPGYVGFVLGPKFKVVDTLGLASPGVARAILAGNLDYPFQKWQPEYVISSWKGKYDPTARQWFNARYRLHAEFEHPHWAKMLHGPYQVYKRIR